MCLEALSDNANPYGTCGTILEVALVKTISACNLHLVHPMPLCQQFLGLGFKYGYKGTNTTPMCQNLNSPPFLYGLKAMYQPPCALTKGFSSKIREPGPRFFVVRLGRGQHKGTLPAPLHWSCFQPINRTSFPHYSLFCSHCYDLPSFIAASTSSSASSSLP